MEALVRSHVSPLDVAWSTLKKMYGRPLGPHPETGLDMGLPWPMGHIGAPPDASVDHPEYRGRKPSPPSPPVPETANPLPENQPPLSAQEQREEKMFRLRSGKYNSAAHEQWLRERGPR